MVEIENGVIEEAVHESDRRFGSVLDWDQVSKPSYTFRDLRIQYDQRQDPERGNWCTVYMAMGMYSDLTGYKFTKDEQLEIYDLAVERWLDPDYGWYLSSAVDLVRKYVNARDDLVSVSSARVQVAGDDYYKAIDMGFSVGTWYGGNKTYNKDRDDDIILQINTRGAATYHHAIRHAQVDDNVPGVVDNYLITRGWSNVYENPEIDKKVEESKEYFTRGYIYFNKITLPIMELPKHITRDQVDTPKQAQAIIAWENEATKWIEKGNKLLYTDYWSDLKEDIPLMLAKMMDDLQVIRPTTWG